MQPARMQPAQLGARRQVWILKGRREEDEPYRARWEHGAHPRRAGCRDSSWFRSGVPGLTLYRARSHGRDGQPPGLHEQRQRADLRRRGATVRPRACLAPCRACTSAAL